MTSAMMRESWDDYLPWCFYRNGLSFWSLATRMMVNSIQKIFSTVKYINDFGYRTPYLGLLIRHNACVVKCMCATGSLLWFADAFFLKKKKSSFRHMCNQISLKKDCKLFHLEKLQMETLVATSLYILKVFYT